MYLLKATRLICNDPEIMAAAASQNVKPESLVTLQYTLRFDDRGYIFDDIEKLISNFQRAINIERVVFETAVPRLSNTPFDIKAVVWLDSKADQERGSHVTITSPNSDWVDWNYNGILDILLPYKTWYRAIRTAESLLTVQILAVATMFMISLILARKIAPQLIVESGFVIAFSFILLMLFNVWGYLSPLLLRKMNQHLPNIYFRKKSTEDWAQWWKKVAIGGLGAFTIWGFAELVSEVSKILLTIFK